MERLTQRDLYQKLGVETRAAATTRALEATGLIPPVRHPTEPAGS